MSVLLFVLVMLLLLGVALITLIVSAAVFYYAVAKAIMRGIGW